MPMTLKQSVNLSMLKAYLELDLDSYAKSSLLEVNDRYLL